MAGKGRNVINSILYIIMSVMAMNFLAICIYLIMMHQLGFYNTADLNNVLQVLVGNRQYVLSKEQIQEYNELREERENRRKALNKSDGSDSTREKSAEALDDMRKQLEEKIRALRELRTQNEKQLADLRASIEQLKADYTRERQELDNWKQQNTKAQLSTNYKMMEKTLQAMEPDVIANLFSGNMQRAGGAEENARLIRQYLPPDLRSEVLGIMEPKDMRQIVPLLEDKYADMDPNSVVKAWTTPGTADFKTPEQMALHLRNMTVSRAFTIFTLLDPKNRAELVRLLKLPSSDDKGN